MSKKENVLVISDLHLPFTHKKALSFCKSVYEKYNCKKVINLGDIVDSYCFSKYTRDPDAMRARDEVIKAQYQISKWADVFPEMIICRGNHDLRLAKRLIEIGIPVSLVTKNLSQIFEMSDGWKWVNDYTYRDVLYTHGSKTGMYAHVNTAKDMRCSVVMGHTHKAGIHYLDGFNNTIFGACAGCLIDQETYAFAYAKDMTSRPSIGCMVVLEGKIPVFIRM